MNSAADTLVQATICYASGVPMVESKGISYQYYNVYGVQPNQNFGRDEQPYLYNGKEFIEAHGLNEYDSQARMYYATIMRTTTMDPHAENRYHVSPYVWCRNNPINCIDPNGEDDIFNELGVYLRHIDNGTNYVMVEDANRELQNITTFSYAENKVAHRAMLENIGTYYAQKIGLNQDIGVSSWNKKWDSEFPPAMLTKSQSRKVSFVVRNDNTIAGIYDVSYNIMNSFVHERFHVGDEDRDNRTIAEVQAILTQINHPTWEKTTDEYKFMTIRYMIYYANIAIENNQYEMVKNMMEPSINIINKVIPICFSNGMMTSQEDTYHIDSQEIIVRP